MDDVVRCENVSFSYGRRQVMSGVTLGLSRGVTGLLGVNGAGKSTLMRILATLRHPSTGSVRVLGNDVCTRSGRAKARRQLGYLPQAFELMGFSTVLSNVEYAAWAHGIAEADVHEVSIEALRAVDLVDLRKQRARTLSGGQRQRLGIACATAHKPALLLMDEPTVGVDPLQRTALREMIATLGKRSTVLLSTHLVDDIARLADHVLVMERGRLAFDGSTEELIAKSPDATDRTAALEAAFTMVASS
ncbi:ABC transporter ATP-binding protein [Bifidobacterium psychraerophilum]|uniref:ABC transporter ATP-binding protein n=1 Tax=Bifidobacterium psychraerophilum TaxID=218140 RepID=UPI0023F2846E|nr:ATP-binding cassette domain-containing protein [Bifidobacterium psychraerophilum]MCI1660195.1 ATP-binding cassette domain-containing protein [Bifidobacterium psychraerophilum]MCI1804159.1 ATP-binding cassette domain-containing protein [Bifidobacterium psychraerophilum]MCI2176481.1 ATP-binding cassette domain-containing protein [Bifidobacterium psychraerophilum]MCI2181997.1 ATP-binding cassette domain-containing protein [Bifidobacterium psychraerophilum]